MLLGKGDTLVNNTSSNKSYSSKYQQEENRLIKNIFEVLVAPLIHFPPATVPGKNVSQCDSSLDGRALVWGLERRKMWK